MNEWGWFFVGFLVAWTPIMIVLVILLLRAREGGRS
jgi:hypothetical protein